jgi:hypothetical protein
VVDARRRRRRLVLPALIVLYSLLWATVRLSTASRAPASFPGTRRVAVGLAVAVAASALLAASLPAVPVDAAWLPAPARHVLLPSNGTVLLVAFVTLALVGYVGGSSVVAVPRWLAAAARPAGVVLGWPLALVLLGRYALGNALPGRRPPFVVEALVTALGVALSAVWIVALAAGVAAVGRRLHASWRGR